MESGYYLVIDETDGTGHGDAVSDFIVEIVGNATFTPKSTSVPTFDKIIDDNNPLKGIVTISYVDEDGNALAENEVLDGIFNTSYSTEAKTY